MSIKTETALLSRVKGDIKPSTIDVETVWSNYRRQFEVAAEYNGWTNQEKTTVLIFTLKGKTSGNSLNPTSQQTQGL